MYSKIKNNIYKTISSEYKHYLPAEIFNFCIITLIFLNLITIVLNTFSGLPLSLRKIFNYIDIISVAIFTIEYILRIWTANLMYPDAGAIKSRLKYLFSFMALVDLAAILPFYLPFIVETNYSVLRVLRLARLTRIFKVNRYTKALSTILEILKEKMAQLASSFLVILILMIISSVLMYNFEYTAQPNVFKNAFSGLWWSVATFTTVGYGDIYPITTLGKIFSAIIAILGIGLVAVPTGIISAGFIERTENLNNTFLKYHSPAEELLKYKQLLDLDIITKEEFQEKNIN